MGNIRERGGITQQAAGGENGAFFIWIPSNGKLLSQLRKSFYVHNRIEVPLVPVPRARGASGHLASSSVRLQRGSRYGGGSAAASSA